MANLVGLDPVGRSAPRAFVVSASSGDAVGFAAGRLMQGHVTVLRVSAPHGGVEDMVRGNRVDETAMRLLGVQCIRLTLDPAPDPDAAEAFVTRIAAHLEGADEVWLPVGGRDVPWERAVGDLVARAAKTRGVGIVLFGPGEPPAAVLADLNRLVGPIEPQQQTVHLDAPAAEAKRSVLGRYGHDVIASATDTETSWRLITAAA